MAPRRTTSPTKAHEQAFHHFIVLRDGCDIGKWRVWLTQQFGEVRGGPEWVGSQRWGLLGSRVGFKEPDDVVVFVEAAMEDLARGKKSYLQ